MKLNPIHGLLGVLGAGAGLWFWSEKRKKASGVNTAVLNNPPPQDAVALNPLPMYIAARSKIQKGDEQTFYPRGMNSPQEVGQIIWVESGTSKPRIVIQVRDLVSGRLSDNKLYATPGW